MCGIFGYVGKRTEAANITLNGLKLLDYRGYDSWGIAVAIKNRQKLYVKKQVGKIENATIDELQASAIGFGHTRWATHGEVTRKNAHPHVNEDKSLAIIHNGIIENYDTIKNKLVKKGHVFASNTDSETAVHLIEEHAYKHSFINAVRSAFLKLKGFNALIALSASEDKLIAVRNGSSLVVGFGRGANYIASDAAALAPYTEDVYFLRDNELVAVGKNRIILCDIISNKRKRIRKTRLKRAALSVNKGTYPHYMLKEIHEQPRNLQQIARNGISHSKKLARLINRSNGTYLIGCGTAYHACISGSYLFSKIAKFHINPCIGSEFEHQLDYLSKDSLVIALSQSGETIDTLEAVKKARDKGALIGALVNMSGSTLYREADMSILLGAGVEKSVATTKAFTSKIAYLVLAAYALSNKPQQGTYILRRASASVKALLTKESIKHIRKIAGKIRAKKHVYVVGRGLSYPVSLEAALKIKEISYIHAEGFAAGELKHGVIALIEKGTPCIVFAPRDRSYSANLAGAMEMQARGGYIIGVSHKKHEAFDCFVQVEDAEEATIIPHVVFSQLLAYHLAVIKGLDPDKPRNLAKSVTVK